jgi:hypothetical protein
MGFLKQSLCDPSLSFPRGRSKSRRSPLPGFSQAAAAVFEWWHLAILFDWEGVLTEVTPNWARLGAERAGQEKIRCCLYFTWVVVSSVALMTPWTLLYAIRKPARSPKDHIPTFISESISLRAINICSSREWLLAAECLALIVLSAAKGIERGRVFLVRISPLCSPCQSFCIPSRLL